MPSCRPQRSKLHLGGWVHGHDNTGWSPASSQQADRNPGHVSNKLRSPGSGPSLVKIPDEDAARWHADLSLRPGPRTWHMCWAAVTCWAWGHVSHSVENQDSGLVGRCWALVLASLVKQNLLCPTGSAADLCKMAMVHIFAAVATSPTLTARSVSERRPLPGFASGACCSVVASGWGSGSRC